MTSGITPHLYRGSVFLWREFMSRVVRQSPAIMVILYLGASTADRAVGQVRESAMASSLGVAAPSSGPGITVQTRYDAKRGQSLYTTNCSPCHQVNGEGRVGAYPPLKGSGVVTKNDATKHVRIVLNGLQGAKAGGVVYASSMPPFESTLNDSDIADIIDYERSTWGNHGQLVTAAQVAAERGRSN
jgi:cytochrome c oxidase cbb3-type subunit II